MYYTSPKIHLKHTQECQTSVEKDVYKRQPLGPRVKKGTVIATVALNDTKYEIVSGRLALISLGLRAGNTIEISPRRDFDVGAGRGNVCLLYTSRCV